MNSLNSSARQHCKSLNSNQETLLQPKTSLYSVFAEETTSASDSASASAFSAASFASLAFSASRSAFFLLSRAATSANNCSAAFSFSIPARFWSIASLIPNAETSNTAASFSQSSPSASALTASRRYTHPSANILEIWKLIRSFSRAVLNADATDDPSSAEPSATANKSSMVFPSTHCRTLAASLRILPTSSSNALSKHSKSRSFSDSEG
mmetsp:Transcript_5508/g.9702  ORF Transcript_5508/g.9702 Transcript_5508/m.9702 type:complete len:210 (-) Transcript_5508:540-1169(-)